MRWAVFTPILLMRNLKQVFKASTPVRKLEQRVSEDN